MNIKTGTVRRDRDNGISDYAINPYTGCTHGCVYCYARFMKRFTNHPEPWGAFLDAKVNAPEVLARELNKRREPLKGEVFLSSVTDAYQPAESRYQLTRRILEILLEHQASISILTKSDLVVRDLDLLKQFQHIKVGLSLSTIDDQIGKHMEPRASAPSRRVQALRKLHDAGIYTYVFISPYLPQLSDLDQNLEALQGSIDEFGVEAINMIPTYWAGVETVLTKYYPERKELCRLQSQDDGLWQALENQSTRRAAEMNVIFMGFFRHGKG